MLLKTGGKFATGVNDTSAKFATGVNNIATGINDTGDKFDTGVNDTEGKKWEQYQTADNLKCT